MSRYIKLVGVLLVVGVSLLFFGQSSQAKTAALYTFHTVAVIPGWDASACYDILDEGGSTVYVTDATNASVDAITGSHVQLLAKGVFAGPAGCHSFDFSQEGPTGVRLVHGNIWAGNGNSDVKVLSTNGTVLHTISTGPSSNKRADELDYIPVTNQVVVANPDATPPYLTYINASTFQVVAQQQFPQATAGLEQPRFAYGLLFQAIPTTTTNPGGEIDVINPFTRHIIHVYANGNCGDSGLAIVAQYAAIGCANGPSKILNLLTGSVVTLSIGAGADMVAGDAARGRFFFADYASSQLIITGLPGNVVQQLPGDGLSHSVFVDQPNGEVYFPVGTALPGQPSGGVQEYTLSH
jgi:hypothetical protein